MFLHYLKSFPVKKEGAYAQVVLYHGTKIAKDSESIQCFYNGKAISESSILRDTVTG